jgi:hypothetical protein
MDLRKIDIRKDMKYKVGDIIKTIDEYPEPETSDQLDIEKYLYKEYYMGKIGIIIKVNKREQLYTVIIAGIEGKKNYLREYMIEKKINNEV